MGFGVLLLSCLVILPSLAWGCPDLWIGINNSCYRTSTEPMNWYEAQQYCIDQGGYLIEINNDDEQAALYSFLAIELDYWCGLADFAQEGVWVWQHSFQEANFTFWDSGEPNSEGNEDCAELHAYSNFAWLDGDCNTSEVVAGCPIHALCETENV